MYTYFEIESQIKSLEEEIDARLTNEPSQEYSDLEGEIGYWRDLLSTQTLD